MFQLPGGPWIRFAIWLVLGLVFYFFYGYRHSVLRNRDAAAAREEEKMTEEV
jgi:APA family basic amino acid/polyamine antiporter